MKECNNQKFRAIDFFCGGGLAYELRYSGIDVIAGEGILTGMQNMISITNSKMM
jgi:hypothetical protein